MSAVVIQECKGYELENVVEKINSGIELLGGWDKFIKPGMTVLLKVNLLGPKPAESATITHPVFVHAVAKILAEKQCRVWIGDSSGGAMPGKAVTGKSFTVSGIENVAKETGAEIKNFDREGVAEAGRNTFAGEPMLLAKPLFEADVVINMPKFKTHMLAVYTGAVKNLFGCVPGLKKAEYHKRANTPAKFGEVLADINQALKVDLHIVDGITAMNGDGPTAGKPYQAGKILIGTDALALDTAACKMINLDIKNIPFYRAVIERKLGEYDLDKLEIRGDYSEVPQLKGFRLPHTFGNSRIYGMMTPFINLMKVRPVINLHNCKRCNVCVLSCPVKAIDGATKKIDFGKCIECMCCHELCMHKAVELKRVNPLMGLLESLTGRG